MTTSEREPQIEQILDGYGDGFVAFDRDWTITYCNRAAEAYAGMSREAALGRVYWDVVPSAAGSAFEGALRKAMEQRVAVELEVPSAIRPGGFAAVRAYPIEGGLAISFGDITERRRREQREREQAQRLELALAASGLGGWSWNAASDIVTFSERAAVIFGLPANIAMTWTDMLGFLNLDDADLARRAVEGAMTRGGGYEIEYRVTPPGEDAELWIMSRAQAEYAPDGTLIGLQGVVGDISRRKAQDAQLRDSEARFRVMADSAPAPIWMTTAEGPIEFVNRAFAEYAGKPAQGLTGPGVWPDLLHPDDGPEVLRRWTEAVAAGAVPYGQEVRFRHASGEWRLMRASQQPRFDAAGAFQGYVGLATDITEIRAAETRQQLLINELNHRVKNTLATVQSIARQTLRDDVAPRVARAQFTERLLALSAVHNVLTREHWESAELADIAAEAVRPYDQAEAARITIEGPGARVSPSAALALSMAFHELATNATKHGALSAPEGRVSLMWSLQAGAVQVLWRERGGPPVSPPAGKGFGSRLLAQGLAAELGQPAVLTYDPAGVVCAITAPLAEG